jgi:hypothetical protein
MSTPAHVAFVPWVRQGITSAIPVADEPGANLPAAIGLSAAVSVNATPPIPVQVRLRGPADVIGIDPNEIVRLEPRPATMDFEPNYFPCIEFDRPDFPWLFTPARAAGQGRLRPWLSLVVVRQQKGVTIRPPTKGPLPVLEISSPAHASDELPDLGESWAWAHAQAASGSPAPDAVAGAFRGPPELSLSRLLCPRVLAPLTEYLACVVPAFDVGRRVGLGEKVGDQEVTAAGSLKPAWVLAPDSDVPVTLPVYFHWEFRTGPGGDFESLVELLHAEPAPARLGFRPIDVGRPGFPLLAGPATEPVLALESALQPIDRPDVPPPWPAGLAESFQAGLAPIVNLSGNSEIIDPAAEPILAPPLYGRWHAARPMAARNGASWFDVLNLDPRYRATAAFGTAVVQEHQEALMAAAWAQAGDLQEANDRVRRLQLSVVVNTSLIARHLARLDDEAVVRVAAPAFGRIRSEVDSGASATTLAGAVEASLLPLDAVSTLMRRLGRQRGPLTRRGATQGVIRLAERSWIGVLNESSAPAPEPPAFGLATFNVVLGSLPPSTRNMSFTEVTASTIADTDGRPEFQIAAAGETVGVMPVEPLPQTSDSPAAGAFRTAAREHLTLVDPGRLAFLTAPPPPLPIGAVRTRFLDAVRPDRTLTLLAEATITVGPTATSPTGPTPETAAPVRTIMAAPHFSQPMYEPLRDLGQDLLLPGLDSVAANVALGLKTNRRFVEAYMVGLNVEMGRELLWRGFPTDQRGTCFDRFWDSRTTSRPRPDIAPIHEWGDRKLGDAQGAPGREQFVLLLRSDLLRRYPTAIIYAIPAKVEQGRRAPDDDPAKEEYPVFRGRIDPDVTFFGFDLAPDAVTGTPGYYIVIQEHSTEPRFGLEVDTPAVEGTHVSANDDVPGGLPLDGLEWGRNAAHVAGILRQRPVRVLIHASRFLKPR